ncbi:lysozyme inhibitor LprI family protein [Xanthomonas arboricola]|uniref:lysozyme inhibitor LprI family protein n=1 Tax=Xanthomonas arboricola TaxID=56448 RepID=UPI000E1E4696|nr:lysozyme inhibitor LprI family protein [Xanthomonas arboricola]
MKTAATIFAICLVLFVDGVALASESTAQVIKRQAPKGITSAFYECIEEAESDNVALAACQSTEKKRQDTRLNAAYKLLLSKQRDTSKDNLVRAERAWLELHGTSKAFESSLYGSEIVSSFQVMQNEIFRLCERANTLEEYLSVADDR